MTPRDPRPTPRETLLLRAALLDGDAAREAWTAWRAEADLDRIDQASFRLLPLAYRNLERLEVDDPWLGRLRGFYRRAWAENQILFRRLAAALDALHRERIGTIVLKGVALASQAYRDAGARPMADGDVLVPRRDFVSAVACLRRAGWSTDAAGGPLFDESPTDFRARHHALGFLGAGDRLPALDLHDRPLQVYGRHPVDFPETRLWADAESFELSGTVTRRLSPEHALIHTCFHGLQRQNNVASIRWVADADRLVRAHAGRLAWDRMIDDARRADVVSALKDALGFLATEFGTPVPPTVLGRLRRTPLRLVDRLERAMRLAEPSILADYGKSIAPALRRARERGASRRPRIGAVVRTAYRLAVRLPKRHLHRALVTEFVSPPETAEGRRAAYERDGFVAGGPLLSDDELAALRAEFDRIFAQGVAAPFDFKRIAVGPRREFHAISNLHQGSRAFEEVARHPRLVERLAEITGLDALRVLRDQVQYKPPRIGGRNSWHRDMPSFPLVPPYTGLTAWIALDDATKHTGCMRMVPGSHRFGAALDLAVDGDGWGLPGVDALERYRGHPVRIVARPVRAGHVHFHHDMVWHASGHNGTRHKRRALAIHFVGADDLYREGRWTKLPGLQEGDRLDAAAPLVVRYRGEAAPST